MEQISEAVSFRKNSGSARIARRGFRKRLEEWQKE
jgi:hypothetical protein